MNCNKLSAISLRLPALPLLSGMLLGASFPTWPGVRLELFAWIALVPILVSLDREFHPGPFFRKVLATTSLFCMISLWWICLATVTGGLLTIAVQSLFSTIPFLLFFMVRRWTGRGYALFALPFLWTGWEWAYMQQELSLGWLTLGNSQANLLWMVQYADLTGVWGVSFWVVAFNVLVFALISNRGRTISMVGGIALLALMVVAPLLYAWHVFDTPPGQDRARSVRVALVQPDIDPHLKWGGIGFDATLDRLLRLTGRSLAGNPADLVLWPETAIPFFIRNPEYASYMDGLRHSVDGWKTPLLTGVPDIGYPSRQIASADAGQPVVNAGPEIDYPAYNASMLLLPGQEGVQVYRKMRLVPFGERVPYLDYFPWLERMSFSMSGISSWQRGRETTVMTVRSGNKAPFMIGNVICYESIFPGLVSKFAAGGAELLTLVTNDGWYGTSYGPWQHAAIGRIRCIENRRAMARCANTGVTLAYDRYGRTIAETPWWRQSVLTVDVPLETGLTFYTKNPDLFPKACLGIGGLILLLGVTRREQQGAQGLKGRQGA